MAAGTGHKWSRRAARPGVNAPCAAPLRERVTMRARGEGGLLRGVVGVVVVWCGVCVLWCVCARHVMRMCDARACVRRVAR